LLSNLSDTLILIIVAVLLLAGEKDLSGTMKNIGKYWDQLRRSETDFKNEIIREVNGIDMDLDSTVSSSRPFVQASDARIRELERQVRELQEELERMKKENGKG